MAARTSPRRARPPRSRPPPRGRRDRPGRRAAGAAGPQNIALNCRGSPDGPPRPPVMNAIDSSQTAGTAVVMVMVVTASWTAPLGCSVQHAYRSSFRSIYSDASTIYRDSHSVKVISDIPFRTLSKWPTPRPPPASPARAASAASSPARACGGPARAPPTRCAATKPPTPPPASAPPRPPASSSSSSARCAARR